MQYNRYFQLVVLYDSDVIIEMIYLKWYKCHYIVAILSREITDIKFYKGDKQYKILLGRYNQYKCIRFYIMV